MAGVKGKSGGHNKKTNSEKSKLGVRKDRINKNAPTVPKGELIEFDGLCKEAKNIYDTYLPLLQSNGTLGVTDGMIFHRFCIIAAEWIKYNKECAEKGRVVQKLSNDGSYIGEIPAAWHKIEMDLSRQLDLLTRELGLSPLSRDGINKIADEKKQNQWAIKK